MAINRTVFFADIRQTVFGGFLEQSQVDGVTAVLDEWEARGLRDPRWLDYMLAIDRHETGAKMQPVREDLHYKSAERIREVWPSRFPTVASARPYVKNARALAIKVYGGRLGNAPAPSSDGWDYRGDGLPQLTGKGNFAKFGVKPGMDLKTSVRVMFDGMIGGLFTGRRLSEFFSATADSPAAARAIVNPDGNGELVAGYYRAFQNARRKAESAFVEGGHAPSAPVADDVPVTRSGAAITVGAAAGAGCITAGGAAATAAVSGINNQWALIAFGMVLLFLLICGGVGLRLWLTGRLTIARRPA